MPAPTGDPLTRFLALRPLVAERRSGIAFAPTAHHKARHIPADGSTGPPAAPAPPPAPPPPPSAAPAPAFRPTAANAPTFSPAAHGARQELARLSGKLRGNHELTQAEHESLPDLFRHLTPTETAAFGRATGHPVEPAPVAPAAAPSGPDAPADRDPTAVEPLRSPDEYLAALAHPAARATRSGSHPEADHLLRGAAADALQGAGRNHEADLLRDGRHVVVRDGRVVPARYTLAPLRAVTAPLGGAAGVRWPRGAAARQPDARPAPAPAEQAAARTQLAALRDQFRALERDSNRLWNRPDWNSDANTAARNRNLLARMDLDTRMGRLRRQLASRGVENDRVTVSAHGQEPEAVHPAEAPAALARQLEALFRERGTLDLPAAQQAIRDARAAEVEEADPAVVHGYDYKPDPRFHRGEDAPTLGAELEVAAPPREAGNRAAVYDREDWARARLAAARDRLVAAGGRRDDDSPAARDYRQAAAEFDRARGEPVVAHRLPYFGSHEHLRAAARQTLDKLNRGLPREGFAYLKTDGSIRGRGFEIVTHPATLDVHKQRWAAVLAPNNEAALASDSALHGTGLHVHIGRDALTELGVWKMLGFVNAAGNRAYVEAVARRDPDQWAKINPDKKPTDALKRNSNRYEAVNLQNANTVELRIFGGTLDPHEFFTSLEFADALAHFAGRGERGAQEIHGPEAFLDFVAQRRKRYPHLARFNAEYARRLGKAVAPDLGGAVDGGPPVTLSVSLRVERKG